MTSMDEATERPSVLSVASETSTDQLNARIFAADLFTSALRPDLAAMVIRGDGDDFPEVSAALSLLQRHSDQLARQEQALRCYADDTFWDDELPGGSLALHDKGEMARNVLAGRRPFYHRD